MRATKSILEKYKGLFSFLLVVVVLYTGSIKGFLAADLLLNEVAHQKHYSGNHSQCDIHTNHTNVFSAVDQAKSTEAEIDEAHLDFIFLKSDLFTFILVEKQYFCQFLNKIKVHKLPLYDLYCNWKFHLI